MPWLSGFLYLKRTARGPSHAGQSIGCIWVRKVTRRAEICTWNLLFYSIFRMCLLRFKARIRLVTQIFKSWPGTVAKRRAFNTC